MWPVESGVCVPQKMHGKPLYSDSPGSEIFLLMQFHVSREMAHSYSRASQLPFWQSLLLNVHLPCCLMEHRPPATLFKKQFPLTAYQSAFLSVQHYCTTHAHPADLPTADQQPEATLTMAMCGCPPAPAVPNCSCNNL